MRPAVRLAPNRWMKRRRSILVLHQVPTRVLVGDEVHVKSTLTAAWTKHRRLLQKTVVLNNIKCSLSEAWREVLLDDGCLVWRIKQVAEPALELGNYAFRPGPHAFRLSDSSGKRRRGVVSPTPTYACKISQHPSSGSSISSMLDKLNVTLAYSRFGSSRKG